MTHQQQTAFENIVGKGEIARNDVYAEILGALDFSKLKVFADSKLNINERLKIIFGKIENTVGKAGNVVRSILFISYNVFEMLFSQCRLKSDCVIKALSHYAGVLHVNSNVSVVSFSALGSEPL